jgi:hypothetical protein
LLQTFPKEASESGSFLIGPEKDRGYGQPVSQNSETKFAKELEKSSIIAGSEKPEIASNPTDHEVGRKAIAQVKRRTNLARPPK